MLIGGDHRVTIEAAEDTSIHGGFNVKTFFKIIIEDKIGPSRIPVPIRWFN